jgi:hypothetical protein
MESLVDGEVKINWKDLATAAGHWLDLFDKAFAQDDVPLHARPIKAAMWLVKDGISELPFGDSKQDYFDKEWFAALVVAVNDWYKDRYGADAFNPVRDVLGGIVELHGTPVKLEPRVTVAKVEVEGETSWMIFADSIHESEKVFTFFPSKPNLDSLEPTERANVENRVAEIVRSNRSINLALRFAADLSDEATQMAAGVWRHVEKGISDILTLDQSNAAVGCWELHLAVEKAFKVFLQQNGKKLRTHDLNALSEKAKPFGLVVTAEKLDKLPFWKTSIEYRYAEQQVAIPDAIDIYDSALQLLYEITSKLRREIVINNAGFLLKKPKWVGR